MNEAPAVLYNTISINTKSTVVAEAPAEYKTGSAYQSEAELEREFIDLLKQQQYEFLTIRSELELIANVRKQLELLNDIQFTDKEWTQFFEGKIASKNDGIAEKTYKIQQDFVQLLDREDGTTKNITLIDKVNIHKNRLQVINQYEIDQAGGAKYKNRFDVTILVNGLPMVHVEIKRRGVDIREAFNQIGRYQRDSFWSGTGLYEYVQLFVISNGTYTKYYSNTTRKQHLDESKTSKKTKRTSNSFEFTSWWADGKNKPIFDLPRFAQTFFARHTLLNILTRYCVLNADGMLMVMRPYQIAATEKILQKIQVSTNYKKLGTIDAGGYIWHTTGSGKTLTSFKAAQLATQLTGVDKVLFVVDRKDLDYQTMREYDRFEKGAANSNTSTAILKRQLEDPNAKIIITTIQKLSSFISANAGHEIYKGHIVIIFDEAHRSQFGDMHTAITRAFKNYNLFGFTGTPIFSANMSSGGKANLRTTQQAFGEQLHSYTIVNAIDDKNVLPFHVDFHRTIAMRDDVQDKNVSAIDTENALLAPERIRMVVEYILEHFDQKTKRNQSYPNTEGKRLYGFNSLFATASIKAAQRYYEEFRKQQARLPSDKRLKVGIIYSYAANPDMSDGILGEEEFETGGLTGDARDFLESAIADYNAMWGTNFDTSSARFENYYKDLSLRLKNRDMDLVIVVNMFLTGFDATTLNTLWVDKNLRMHGLIQAYSRTNRILNSVKTFGNIVTFRDLEQETNDAIALFGNRDAKGTVLLEPYSVYESQYKQKVAELVTRFPVGELIIGEENKKDFVTLFGSILKLQNILTVFDEFVGNDLLSARDNQDYQGMYLHLYAEMRPGGDGEKEPIIDDLVFEIELIRQIEVNVDYILMLVEKYRKERGDGDDVALKTEIFRAVDSSPTLRSKRDLIEGFVDGVSAHGPIDEEWVSYIGKKKEEELEALIAAENLKPEPTRVFVNSAFRDGRVQTTGTAVTGILPSTRRFGASANHQEKKNRVLDRLVEYFDRFAGLVGN